MSDSDLASIRLTDIVDMGALPLSGQLAGLRLDERQELSSGWAWSQDEVLVCRQPFGGLSLMHKCQLFDVSVLPLCALGTIRLRNVCDFLRHEGNLATVRFAASVITLGTTLRDLTRFLECTGSRGATQVRCNRFTWLRKPHILTAAKVSFQSKVATQSSIGYLSSRVLQSCASSSVEVSAISGAGEVIFARRKHNHLRLESMRLAVASSERASSVLWKVGRSDKSLNKITNAPRISAMLPLELNELILGYSKEPSYLLHIKSEKGRRLGTGDHSHIRQQDM